MQYAFRVGLLVLLVIAFFGTSALLVSASASVTQFTIGCDRFTASGTSDAPYVTIYAGNDSNLSYAFVVVPVTGGSYSGSVSYPAAPAGTTFGVEVWGTLVSSYANFGDSGYWDGGSLFDTDAPCAQAANVNTCPNPLPPGSTVYNVPQGAPAFYDADPNTKVNFDLPAGTWEISDFSGDYAHVWIACQAAPIWIPKSAVGSPVG